MPNTISIKIPFLLSSFSGWVIGPSHHSLPDKTQHSQEKDIDASGGIRVPQSKKANDCVPIHQTAWPIGSACFHLSNAVMFSSQALCCKNSCFCHFVITFCPSGVTWAKSHLVAMCSLELVWQRNTDYTEIGEVDIVLYFTFLRLTGHTRYFWECVISIMCSGYVIA